MFHLDIYLLLITYFFVLGSPFSVRYLPTNAFYIYKLGIIEYIWINYRSNIVNIQSFSIWFPKNNSQHLKLMLNVIWNMSQNIQIFEGFFLQGFHRETCQDRRPDLSR